MRCITIFFLLFIFLILPTPPVFAVEDAHTIIQKVDERQSVTTSWSELSMLVYPEADDTENVREFRLVTYGKGDDDTYVEFLSPRSIRGLKLLSKGDDQWIYFASTGRCRKISSNAQSKRQSVRGVGGDFSYEDLGGGKLQEKYSFKLLESIDKEWVLEGTPKKAESVYARIVILVQKESYLVNRIEYYTEEEGHYKDLIMEDVRSMGGREIATRMTMLNHEKSSKTVMIIHSARHNVPINDKYFNPTRFYN